MELSASEQTLLQCAREAANKAFCPYSGFPVGAAVETELGIFVGCNVENASYGLCCCAERVALFSAIARGAKQMKRLAVCCPEADPALDLEGRMPCGACRQVMAELMPPEAVTLIEGVGKMTVAELLPRAFRIGVKM